MSPSDRTTPESPDAPHGPLPGGGAVRPITRWGSPVMHRAQQPVTTYDEALRTLAADMVATMYAADGVGLAACQVGEDVALFVFDCPDEDGYRVVGLVCNPEVQLPEGPGRRLDVDQEGCLSLPGAFTECARPDTATVTGTGLDGGPVTYTGTGLLARCLQHETDHTRGTVFGDRLPAKARKRLHQTSEQAAEDFPTHWPASTTGRTAPLSDER